MNYLIIAPFFGTLSFGWDCPEPSPGRTCVDLYYQTQPGWSSSWWAEWSSTHKTSKTPCNPTPTPPANFDKPGPGDFYIDMACYGGQGFSLMGSCTEDGICIRKDGMRHNGRRSEITVAPQASSLPRRRTRVAPDVIQLDPAVIERHKRAATLKTRSSEETTTAAVDSTGMTRIVLDSLILKLDNASPNSTSEQTRIVLDSLGGRVEEVSPDMISEQAEPSKELTYVVNDKGATPSEESQYLDLVVEIVPQQPTTSNWDSINPATSTMMIDRRSVCPSANFRETTAVSVPDGGYQSHHS